MNHDVVEVNGSNPQCCQALSSMRKSLGTKLAVRYTSVDFQLCILNPLQVPFHLLLCTRKLFIRHRLLTWKLNSSI